MIHSKLESALYRGLSFFVLGHIRDDFIKDAFQSLSEIYQWQIDSDKIVPLEPHRFSTSAALRFNELKESHSSTRCMVCSGLGEFGMPSPRQDL